ncbi:MAG TPA: iron-siderophore ABC transporter substrate-binding protein, partial [Dermacoccus sp.]|nr:iron-siderophore ABC transporter substrate-binding protein [Dermacoccus sp.]
MINRRGFFAIAAAGATSALAACSTGSSSDKASSATSGSAGSAGSGAGFPVTIKHALGTAKLEKAPTKVVTAGWSDADILLALGVVPVAAPAITWGGNAAKSSDWFDAKLKEVGGKAPERYSDADGTPV